MNDDLDAGDAFDQLRARLQNPGLPDDVAAQVIADARRW
jgi:hypothetical protein